MDGITDSMDVSLSELRELVHKLKSKLFSVAQMALYMWAQAVFMYISIQKYLFFLCLRFFSAYLPL